MSFSAIRLNRSLAQNLVMISDLSRLGLDHEQNSADWFLVTISAFVKEVSE